MFKIGCKGTNFRGKLLYLRCVFLGVKGSCGVKEIKTTAFPH